MYIYMCVLGDSALADQARVEAHVEKAEAELSQLRPMATRSHADLTTSSLDNEGLRYLLKRDLYLRQRALCLRKRALCLRNRAVYLRKRALDLRKEAVYIRNGSLH